MKVVSTKLSKSEHGALPEMANLLGMNTAEYIRGSIMLNLCRSRDFGMPNELEPQLMNLIEKNEKRFNTGVENGRLR